MNTHDQIRKMVVDFTLGELSEQESSEVEMHLAECQQCKTELKELEAVLECAASMSELSADEQVRESAKQALLDAAADEQKKEPAPGPSTRLVFMWRTVMKSKMTKLGSAAVIIMAVAFSITVVDKLTTPAYAIVQTIKAFKNVRYMHVVRRDKAWNIQDERWIEIGPDGVQARYRQDTPERDFLVVDDRQTVMVHHPDKKTVVLHDANDKCWTWIYAPGKLFQGLADGGSGYCTVKENVRYRGQPAHHLRGVTLETDIYIDPKTKLPIALGDYEIDYEDPPEGTFDIVIPEGVVVVDKRDGAPPSEEPEWMIEEKRRKEMGLSAQDYFEEARRALAGGDYIKAVESFSKTVEIQPGRNWAWFWLGRAHYELGEYDLAIWKFSKVIDMFRSHDWDASYCYFARGLAYARKGMEEAAEEDIGKALPQMILALRNTKAAALFVLADDPLLCADGMREGCHKAPTREQILAMMINHLRIVAGQDFGYHPDATTEENEQAIAAWQEWYENSGQVKVTPDSELVPIPEVVEQAEK